MKKIIKGIVCGIALIIGGIVILGVLFGDSSSSSSTTEASTAPGIEQEEVTEPAAQAPVEELESAPEEAVKKSFTGIGQSFTRDGITYTLTDVEEVESDMYEHTEGDMWLVCRWEIQNDSSETYTASMLTDMQVYCDDLKIRESAAADMITGESPLGGEIAAGKRFKGITGYDIPSDFQKLEITIAPIMLGEEPLGTITITQE